MGELAAAKEMRTVILIFPLNAFEVSRDQADEVTRLIADFAQSCQGSEAKLRGSIYFDASLAP